jgi:hypothetical protein
VTDLTYEDARRRLTSEAQQLFKEMVEAHLSAGPGDKLFIRADSLSGTGMVFTGGGSRRNWRGFDGGAIEDLVGYGLLHLGFSSQGTPNYRVGGEGLAFYRWLMQDEGAAVDQVGEQVQRFVSGSDFATKHPGSAHHLQQAFALLWEGRTDTQVVSEIGDHLRKALMDISTDTVGPAAGGEQEKPIERLQAHLQSQSLGEREQVVLTQLVEVARVVLRLDHRLNHVRDEKDKGHPAATWEEMRRASFLTALVAYELSRI